jgi:hypothetical protein
VSVARATMWWNVTPHAPERFWGNA